MINSRIILFNNISAKFHKVSNKILSADIPNIKLDVDKTTPPVL